MTVRELLLAAVAGLCILGGFAPLSWFVLPWFGFALLFVLWSRSTPWRAAALGATASLVLFGIGSFWILHGLLRHGGFPLPTLIGSTVFAIVLQVAHFALAGLLQALAAPPRHPARVLLAAPAAWMLADWLRQVTMLGFPWLAVGYSQIDSPLGGVAPLGGVFGTGLATLALAGLLARAWLAGRPQYRRWLLVALALPVLGWLVGRLEWTVPTATALDIGVIQGNVRSDVKWQPSELQPTLDLYARETLRLLDRQRLDLVIWPETAIPARRDQVAPFLAGLEREMNARRAQALVGLITSERAAGGHVYFNAALLAGGAGGEYRKRRLVPLTEFLPHALPADWRRSRHAEGVAIFSAGADSQVPIKSRDVVLGLSICFEAAFGELVRDASGATGVLVTITNDDWFADTLFPEQHLDVARMRALESGRYVVRAANSGISAVIDHRGRPLARTPFGRREALVARVPARSGLTPYWRLGDVPAIAFAVALLAAAVGWSRRASRAAGPGPTDTALSSAQSGSRRRNARR